MREKKCPSCGNRISSKSKWFEYPLPIPATTNEEVASLRQPKNSTTFETLVKVPLFQSGIYGLFFGLPAGILLSVAVDGNSFTIVSSTAFLVTGISWMRLSNFFNSLLVPFVEEIIPERKSDKQKPIILEVKESNNTMTIGEIPNSVATLEEIVEFAKDVKFEFSLKKWRIQDVHLTQAEFGGSGKIFSQPNWTKFVRYLEKRKLVEKGKRKNSSYTLTPTGVDFIMKTAKLEL